MAIPHATSRAFIDALKSFNLERITTLLREYPALVYLAIIEVPKNPTEEFFKLIFDEAYNSSLKAKKKHIFFEELFFQLVQTNRLEVIESIFTTPQYKLDINSFTFNGMPFIFYAARNDSKFLELLFKLGANIEAKTYDGTTALIMASYKGQDECVEKLLAAGANIEAKNTDGFTALLATAQVGHVRCVEKLLNAGANPEVKNKEGLTALIMATHAGHVECIEKLLAAGANIEAKTEEGFTALLAAAQGGHVRCVEKLLNAGANPEVKNKEGLTAIIMASYKGHEECVEKLLAAEANIEAKTYDGMTVLIMASYKGQAKCIEKLLTAGANIEAKDKEGFTALLAAVQGRHVRCVKQLLAVGADRTQVINEGSTALILAVQYGYADIVELLLNGASLEYINHKNLSGISAVNLAAERGNIEILKKLIAVGADINSLDLHGSSPIFAAIANAPIEIIKYLIKAGADLTVKNKYGFDILSFAHIRDKPKIANCITKNITDKNLLLKLKKEAGYLLWSFPSTLDIGIKYLEEFVDAPDYYKIEGLAEVKDHSHMYDPNKLVILFYTFFPDKLDYQKAKFYWEKHKKINEASLNTHNDTIGDLLEAIFKYEEKTGLKSTKTLIMFLALYEALNHVIETGNLFKLKPSAINKFAELAQILSYAPKEKEELNKAVEYINGYVKLREFASEVTDIKEEVSTLSKKQRKKADDIKKQLVQKCNEHKVLLKSPAFPEIASKIFKFLIEINAKLAKEDHGKVDFSAFKPPFIDIAKASASALTSTNSITSEISDLEDLDLTISNLRKYIDKKKTAPNSLFVKYFDTSTGYSSEKSKISSADNYPEIFAKLFKQHDIGRRPEEVIRALKEAIKTGIDPLFLKKFLENSQQPTLTKIAKELQAIQLQICLGEDDTSTAPSSAVAAEEKDDKSFVTTLPKVLGKDSQETLEKLINPSQRAKLTTTDFEKLFSDLGHEFSFRKGDYDWVFINNDLVRDYIVSGINPNSSGAVTHKPHGHHGVLHDRFFCDMLKLLESTGVISKTLKPASGAGAAAAISEYNIMIPTAENSAIEKSSAAAGAGYASASEYVQVSTSSDSTSCPSIIPEVFTSEEAPLSDYECMKLSLAGDC